MAVGFFWKNLFHPCEAVDNGSQASIEIVGRRRERDRLDDLMIGLDCGENEVCPPGIEGHDNPRVVVSLHDATPS